MRLLLQTYDIVELQRVRDVLERRGFALHISDEFTFAVPGLPGAEQPRGLWLVDDNDWDAALAALRHDLPPEDCQGYAPD